MLQARSGLGAVVLEDQHVAETFVMREIERPLTIGPQQLLDLMQLEVGQPAIMVGAFYQHLVRADSIHQIVQPVAAPSRRALDAQRGELVADRTHTPSRTVRLRAVVAIGEHLWWRHLLHPGAKRAGRALALVSLQLEIRGTLATLSGHDHPTSNYRVLPKLRHLDGVP